MWVSHFGYAMRRYPAYHFGALLHLVAVLICDRVARRFELFTEGYSLKIFKVFTEEYSAPLNSKKFRFYDFVTIFEWDEE